MLKHQSQTTEQETCKKKKNNNNKRQTNWGGGMTYEAAPAGLGAPPCRSPVPCFMGS